MKSVERLLAFHLSQPKFFNSITTAEIVEEEGEFWLVFEGTTIKKGLWKKKLQDFLWGPVQEMYNTYTATQMLREGYMLITIEGGWIVIKPGGEEYQLQEHTCTCRDYKGTEPCKHLTFRDWHVEYRARQNSYKLNMNK